MKLKFPLVTAAVVALCGGLSPVSQAGVEDHVTFSGFGTFGGVITDTDQADFRRDLQTDGANKSVDTGVDTNIGVQLNVQANSWLSATVQGLAVRRVEHEKNMEIEWAFLKAAPLPGLSLRVGRMAMPTYMNSDSRNVGYANTWLRPPNEVYGLALIPRIEGADVTYSKELGSVRLTGTVLGGNGEAVVAGNNVDVNDMIGGSLQLQAGPFTARVAKYEGDVHIGMGFEDTRASFSGIGVSFDKGNVIAQAEYVQRRNPPMITNISANGWYAMGGYRFGSFTPYVTYASTEPTDAPSARRYLSDNQQTLAAGVRWDATSFAALKLQIERVDTDGTGGISFVQPPLPIAVRVTEPVNVLSATIDFVF